MIHATAASGWSLSGSILTFAMPMLLFIAAATVLYLLFTRPHQVPGHHLLAPAQAAPEAGPARAPAAPAGAAAAAGESTAGQDAADADAREAGPEDAE